MTASFRVIPYPISSCIIIRGVIDHRMVARKAHARVLHRYAQGQLQHCQMIARKTMTTLLDELTWYAITSLQTIRSYNL
jgi:hypothetical protein